MSQRFALVVALAVAAAPALAQNVPAPATPRVRNAPTGLLASLYATSSAVHPDEENAVAERGFGAGGQLGWAFANGFAVVVDASRASIDPEEVDDDYSLGHLDLGARYHFPTQQLRWLPFADAGLSLRTLRFPDATFETPGGDVTGDLEFSGPAFFIGGGLTYFAAPKLGITGSLRVGSGSFSKAKFDGESLDTDELDLDATSVRLHLGASWFPGTRK